MKLARIVLVLTTAALLPTTVIASEHTNVIGIGAISCAKLVDQYRQAPSEVETNMLIWVHGFMSGANTLVFPPVKRKLGAISLDAESASLRDYCNAHPFAQLVDAAQDLYRKLPRWEQK